MSADALPRTWLGAAAIAALVRVTVSGVIAFAQGDTARLEVVQVRPNFYMIVGGGANIGAQIGPNGVVLVNAGTAQASADVIAAVAKLTDQPIRYIIDTSADPDVVGGNANLAKAGRNITSFAAGPNPVRGAGDFNAARVLSHENVVARMSVAGPGGTSPFPGFTWTGRTFADRRRTIGYP